MSDICDVCAGTGVPVSGKPCICGGSGSGADEKAGLRNEIERLTGELAKWKYTPQAYDVMCESMECAWDEVYAELEKREAAEKQVEGLREALWQVKRKCESSDTDASKLTLVYVMVQKALKDQESNEDKEKG